MARDLFAIAHNNTGDLERQYDFLFSRLSTSDQEAMSDFTDDVRLNGRISINMKPGSLLGFLAGGKHMNIYERAESDASAAGITQDEALKRLLAAFYAKRMAFDALFDYSKLFRYGALNIGGLGAAHFGKFSVVLNVSAPGASASVAYLKQDSLKYYMDGHNCLKDKELRMDISSHSHGKMLAALKHSTNISASTRAGWPDMMFSGGDFMEAIFIRNVTPGDIEEVRLSTAEDLQYKRWNAYNRGTNEFDEAEKYAEIKGLLPSGGLRVM
jgi:hypothetical protein